MEATATVSATIAFHDGTFADSDDPHGDGSITAAATAGHIYSDTASGTYTWGILTSGTINEQRSGNIIYIAMKILRIIITVLNQRLGNTTYKWTPPGAITGCEEHSSSRVEVVVAA